VPFFWIPLGLLILVGVAINPARGLFAITLTYALSGPAFTLWNRFMRGRREPPAQEQHAP